MAHIQLKNISKTFGNHTALTGLDLEIADGEFFVLLGETGAGKTTTLRMIAGLEKPSEGQVFIDGVDVAAWGAAERPCTSPTDPGPTQPASLSPTRPATTTRPTPPTGPSRASRTRRSPRRPRRVAAHPTAVRARAPC